MRKEMIITLAALTWACGGGEPAKAPETTPTQAATPAADMPAPPSTVAETAAPPAPAAPAVEEAPAIAVEPLKMTIKDKTPKTIELKADGAIEANGKSGLKIVKNELQTPTGDWVVRLEKGGAVMTRSKHTEKKDGKVVKDDWEEKKVATISDKDELVLEKGGKVWFDDKGALKADGLDGKKGPGDVVKFDGVNAKNKKAALVMFVGMFVSNVTTDMSASSAPAVTPASAPAAKPPAAKK